MEGPQRRDINELLTQGFFTTSRGKSPSKTSTPQPAAPSLLNTAASEAPRDRSRSRVRRKRPPRPTVEDEAVSLGRESSHSSEASSDDPPLRGTVDQVPIILEQDVLKDEAARLQTKLGQKEDDNPERRFVLLPKSDTHPTEGSPRDHEHTTDGRRKDTNQDKTSNTQPPKRSKQEDSLQQSPLARRRSRQDLPTLETKVPRDIPAQYRRSASAYASVPKDHDETPKAHYTARTPSKESFLSPTIAHGKDYFGSAPRYDSSGARPVANGSQPGSRSGTPTGEKRSSGSFEPTRSTANEKMTRHQQLSEYSARRPERPSSKQSDRHSAGYSSRGSKNSNGRYYGSSDNDLTDSDLADSESDKEFKHYMHKSHSRVRKEDDDRHLRSPSRSNRSSMDRRAGTSPLASPRASPKVSPNVSPSQIFRGDVSFERSETFPGDRRNSSRPVSPLLPVHPDTPRIDRLNPLDPVNSRPKSRSNAPLTMPLAPYPGHNSSLPIAIPSRIDLHSPSETRKSPVMSQFDDKRASSTHAPSASPKPDWKPGSFQPPANNLKQPMGSYRRYSEDIEKGTIAPLPSCPRTAYTRGRNDWLTLPNCPGFDICPSCFNSSIAATEFRKHFVQAPPRPPETDVLCDFGSSPWYRIAWLLTLKEKRQSLKLLYGLANIAANEQPCLGKHEAARKWHTIIDPKTGSGIHNFDVCYSCVKSVEVLLPAIKGVFIRTDSHSPTHRVCDLRLDSKRFIQYFDALETTADRADYHDTNPDTRALASLVRRLAQIDECARDADVVDKKWHIITQLPEFTVCPECFDDVVWPELEEGKAIPLMFSKTLQRLPKASCQLYSAKMRGIFRTAVDAEDFKLLASKARERKLLEAARKSNIAELRRREKMGGSAAEVARKEIRKVEDEWARWE